MVMFYTLAAPDAGPARERWIDGECYGGRWCAACSGCRWNIPGHKSRDMQLVATASAGLIPASVVLKDHMAVPRGLAGPPDDRAADPDDRAAEWAPGWGLAGPPDDRAADPGLAVSRAEHVARATTADRSARGYSGSSRPVADH